MARQNTYDVYLHYYLNQAGGGGVKAHENYIRTFRAPQYQRGYGFGSIFRSIIKLLTPIFKSSIAKKAAGIAGKQLFTTGSEIGTDLLSGRPLRESIKARGKAGLENLAESALTALTKRDQAGSGRRRARKRKRASTKTSAPKTKRRRRRRKQVANKGTKTKRRRRKVTAGKKRRVGKKKTTAVKRKSKGKKRRNKTIFNFLKKKFHK